MYRIKKIGVYQTAKVVAIIYFFVLAIIAFPFGIIVYISEIFGESGLTGGFDLLFAFLMPFVYGIIGFFGTAIVCWIYNLVTGSTGGIEIDLEQLGIESEETESS